MSEKQTILVIEDERSISNFICRALSANDYKAIPAYRGKEGMSLFFSHSPDLVLLDLGLPDTDGLDILAQLRGLPREVPIIIISARDRESEKVKALDMGADDYVVKPFGVSELLARIRSALRRSDRMKLSQGIQRDVYQIKDLTVDLARQRQQPDSPGEHGQHPPQAEGKSLRSQVHPHRAGNRLPYAGRLNKPLPEISGSGF